ncbi:hypothetical protein BJ508DRAFT_315543 [Ascobolus immersus RN42]|uniref:SWIM-type domain-containing protein n=1 Tax=Ascobolus immersus RN42 TaxID=1160509 RepID=A0A3N4HAD2_ASCIM|nr:hypothetical protein BJ508DRAFT_315543 [Ascobolus immersus RN42]
MAGRHYGFRTSNIVESLNSLFLEEREMPIVVMLDAILHRVMDRRFERLQVANKLIAAGQQFPPSMLKVLATFEFHTARNNQVERSSIREGKVTEDALVEVTFGRMERRERTVLLDYTNMTGSCTCGRFQENGIPCGHALAFMTHVGAVPYAFIPAILKLTAMRDSYNDEEAGTLM